MRRELPSRHELYADTKYQEKEWRASAGIEIPTSSPGLEETQVNRKERVQAASSLGRGAQENMSRRTLGVEDGLRIDANRNL